MTAVNAGQLKKTGDIKYKFGPVTPITPIWKNMGFAIIAAADVNPRGNRALPPVPLRRRVAQVTIRGALVQWAACNRDN